MRVTHTCSYLQQLVMVFSLLVVNIRVIYLKHMFVENTIHLCIDRNIQPKCYCWYCQLKHQQLKLDYVCTSLHSPLSFRIDVRLEDSFYSYGYRLVVT